MNRRKLFVGNLTYSVNNRQLRELFTRYGEVISVNVLEKKGYGFIEMKTQEEAEKARKALSETEFEGRNLLIDGVRPPVRKKKNPERPGAGRSGQQSSRPPHPSGSPGSGYRGKKTGNDRGSGQVRSGTHPRKGPSPKAGGFKRKRRTT